MGWLGDVVGGAAGMLGGGAGKLGGAIWSVGGGLIGNAAENSVKQKPDSPRVTGFDPSKPLSKDNRLPGQNYWDPSIENELLPAQSKRDANHYTEAFNAGISQNELGISSPGGLPGDDSDPMVAAINKKQENDSESYLRGITTRNEHRATVEATENQNTVAREAAAVYQNEVQNYQQQYAYQLERYRIHEQYKAAQSQAEATLWGSVFGGIGKVGGAALGAV